MAKPTIHCSNQKLNTNMLDLLELSIDVQENPYELELGDVFLLGARKNPKRNFLFVSKLIGKHISIPPMLPLVSGGLLCDQLLKQVEGSSPMNAQLLADSLSNHSLLGEAFQEIHSHSIEMTKPTLFIGFAETATGLGHSVFAPISKNASFIHTTRENIVDLKSSFNFEEEHSHATSHMCFGMKADYFEAFERIVLVDDEITTGNTALNLISSLNKHFPNKEYVIVSILDWRQEEDLERYVQAERELGVSIKVVRLISGEVKYTNKEITMEEVHYAPNDQEKIDVVSIGIPVSSDKGYQWKVQNEEEIKVKSYHRYTGRFGLEAEEKQSFEEELNRVAEMIKDFKEYDKTLALGTGEYMYVPCYIASKMENTLYHSTTRSPIYASNMEGYPVRNCIPYLNPDDRSVLNFIYNVEPNQYEEVFMFFEEEISEADKNYISQELMNLGVKSVKFVVFDYIVEG